MGWRAGHAQELHPRPEQGILQAEEEEGQGAEREKRPVPEGKEPPAPDDESSGSQDKEKT